MEKYVSFNLNHEILVKLTDHGINFWKSYEDNVTKRIQTWLPNYKRDHPLDYYLAKRNAEGFVAIQGWHFVEMFGAVKNPTLYYSLTLRFPADLIEICE